MSPASAQQGITPTTAGAPGAVKLMKDIFAGTCGGISVTLVGHPFDTLKVRLQTQPVDKPIYSGVIDCARKTVQWEGLGGLYKGVSSPLMGQMFFRASLFGAFGESKRFFSKNADGTPRALTPADFYKAGGITGFIAAFSEGPIDFYKSQMQVQIIKTKQDPAYKAPYLTVTECFRATIRENGFRGPFQGLLPTLLRNTPANAVYLGNFEVMKSAATRYYKVPQAELPAWTIIGAAGLGGITYWMVIFPVDCIKSAMQTDTIIRSQRKYADVATTVKLLWKEGGISRFYKGFTPCIIRAAPANAAMLFTVDRVTALMNK